MEKKRLTKREIEKVLPPLERDDAIKQSVRYEREYEESKKQLEDILKKLEILKAELEKLEKSQ